VKMVSQSTDEKHRKRSTEFEGGIAQEFENNFRLSEGNAEKVREVQSIPAKKLPSGRFGELYS
jgi:hypothetical protein